ncbi:uncharacterized protein TNCV_3158521 [Trichonephila clavipes]|nr:uncharacterized protein TNCV_3158521 [Trichonephila clavipes]
MEGAPILPVPNVLVAAVRTLLYVIMRHYSQGLPLIPCDILSENGYFDVSELLNTGYFHLTRHSPIDSLHSPHCATTSYHRAICVLHTHYACKSSTRHIYICDPFTYLQEKNSCHDLCPNPRICNAETKTLVPKLSS